MNQHFCVVLGCRNSVTGANRPNSTCKLLNFPVNQMDLTEIWLRNLNLEGWTPGPESFVCEEHFSLDSFETTDRGRSLKSNAVPTIIDDLDRIISLYEQALCSQYREFLESPTKTEKLRCRLCTVFISSGDAVNIHSDNGNVIKKILECIPILARTEMQDNLPKYICRLCLSDLNTSYRMLKRALESEEFFIRSLKSIYEMNTLETIGQSAETSAVLADLTNTHDQNIPKDFDFIDSCAPDSISCFFGLDQFEDSVPKSVAMEIDGNDWDGGNGTDMRGILNACSSGNPASSRERDEQEESLPTYERDTSECNETSSASKVCFSCEYCSTTYESEEMLEKHLETHIIASWSEDSDATVARSEHTDTENYCKICSLSFPTPQSLMQHSKDVHALKYVGGEAFQEFQCKECGKIYKSKNSLTIHERVHSGARPFACGTCGRCFRSAPNLQQHLLTHEGEKKFKCWLCDRAFARKSSLEVHTRVHTGERPYQCRTCSNKYSQLGDLRRHEKKCPKAPH